MQKLLRIINKIGADEKRLWRMRGLDTRWNWGDVAGFISLVVVIGLMLWLAVSCHNRTQTQIQEQRLCLENNYDGYKIVIGSGGYCTGIRDGQSVTIKASELKGSSNAS